MNGLEGAKNKNTRTIQPTSVLEYKAILFAVSTSMSDLQKSSKGYIEELRFKPGSSSDKIKRTLTSINTKEEKQIHLVGLLSNLIDERKYKISLVHPENLFEKVEHTNGNIKFILPKTNTKSIIGIDEAIFCDSLNALLSCVSKSSRLILNFRKRGAYFVIRISSAKSDWLDTEIFEATASKRANYGMSLHQLIAVYSINLLTSISVKTYCRNQSGVCSLNLRLPAASQLNVFDKYSI